MSAIRSKNTTLEKGIFDLLESSKVKIERHYAGVIGKPDIAIPVMKKVVFIDSDFWHGWRYPTWKHKLSNSFWTDKIEANRRRDKFVTRKLRKDGWRVLRIWSHQLKNPKKEKTIKKLLDFLS